VLYFAAMRAVVLLLAAGQGSRLGAGVPKALVRVGGRTVLERSAAALGRAPSVEAVLPVLGPESGAADALAELRAIWSGPARLLEPVEGGATRQGSLARGLAALARQAPAIEWVLVHDAARCLVESGDAEQVLAAAQATGAAIPVLPVSDTLKEVADGRILATPARSRYARALTPQCFRVELLRRALARAEADGFDGTDCASLVERLGVQVTVCAGREQNLKLTTPHDLAWMEALLLGERRTETTVNIVLKVGQGYDVHRLVEGRPLLLGGVRIPHGRGLAGFSDADVLAHAVGDALLGALGAGDLGTHFPSSDPTWKGISGAALLGHILARVDAAGLAIAHVDSTVIAQEPRLAPHLKDIRESLAALLRVDPARVNVKLKSTDELGAIGRGEGIAAQAVALLEASVARSEAKPSGEGAAAGRPAGPHEERRGT
jgi:2-C-methyl-D-erythritol 4-phosphate cytidylyltransferase/2-C-methyl-D-erythritol 2,4-cyclodiphosphate synthase